MQKNNSYSTFMKKKKAYPKRTEEDNEFMLVCADSIDFGCDDRIPRTTAQLDPEKRAQLMEKAKKRLEKLQKKTDTTQDNM